MPSASSPVIDIPPWREALLWAVLLGAFFVGGYTLTNQWAAAHPDPHSLYGHWDAYVPFFAWTIWPYLSLNLLYPCAFFTFVDVHALRRHAARIALVQAVCFVAFTVWPTTNTRALPVPDGVTGVLFAQLRAFEAPVNMAPSLHAAVLVLVWRAGVAALHAHRAGRMAWHAWCALILLSTLTTWQHDILDVVAGTLLGALALWLVPMRAPR